MLAALSALLLLSALCAADYSDLDDKGDLNAQLRYKYPLLLAAGQCEVELDTRVFQYYCHGKNAVRVQAKLSQEEVVRVEVSNDLLKVKAKRLDCKKQALVDVQLACRNLKHTDSVVRGGYTYG